MSPVCLPNEAIDDVDHLRGHQATLVGWGTDTRAAYGASNKLRRASLAVYPQR